MRNEMAVMAVLVVVAVAAAAYIYIPKGPVLPVYNPVSGIVAFTSESDFKAYIEKSSQVTGGFYGVASLMAGGGSRALGGPGVMMEGAAPTAGLDSNSKEAGADASIYSGTNVQVAGIDEPDIVKTDGKNIYYSSGSGGYWLRGGDYYYNQGTHVIGAFPPEDMEALSQIDISGDMLLDGNTLVIFSWNTIKAYDVSDASSPAEKWSIELNGSVESARLYNGKIYMVTRNYLDYYNPCPIVPFTKGGTNGLVIDCPMIYHPIEPVQTDSTFTAVELDPATGEVVNSVSFVGSYGTSIIYMSEDAIYVTYEYAGDMTEIFYNAIQEKASDLVPADVLEKLAKVNGYDISLQSKVTEFTLILQNYMATLDRDSALQFETELANRMDDYMNEHKREFEKTGIVKINLDLEVTGTAMVPGSLLNQFSLDQHQGNLRVAVTIGRWRWDVNMTNDVYVLDSDMAIAGSATDLGVTERIYSVRFIGDKGYVVTFRETDPLYVLDLSDPANPQISGELKIPGYSSYLHPVTEDKLVGIGKEDQFVKVSLFDVSSAENPTEIDKYSLGKEYWSEALNNHHAFLMDDRHQIFFLPGSSGGYIISYADNKLSLVKAVADIVAQRAVYIDDYLYIVGADRIVVLDENTWEKVNEMDMPSTSAGGSSAGGSGTEPEPLTKGFSTPAEPAVPPE